MKKLEAIRKQYTKALLTRDQLDQNPIAQFIKWFEEATQAEVLEPNAMILATASATGRPTSRTVLLKAVDEQGFVFYTNYESRKGKQLQEKPYGAVTFFWAELERQVNVTGRIDKLTAAASDRYFQSRPRNSKIGAWASTQSKVVTSRTVLEERVQRFTKQFQGQEVPRPTYWGGYCLVPDSVEFWQGRADRLHDRFLYTKDRKEPWKIERLCP